MCSPTRPPNVQVPHCMWSVLPGVPCISTASENHWGKKAWVWAYCMTTYGYRIWWTLHYYMPLCNCPYRRASQADVASPSLLWVMRFALWLHSHTPPPNAGGLLSTLHSAVCSSPSAHDKRTHNYCCHCLDGRVPSVGMPLWHFLDHDIYHTQLNGLQFVLPEFFCRTFGL